MGTKERKWVRCELKSPLQFDMLDVANSLLRGGRIDGLHVDWLNGTLEISLTLVQQLPRERYKEGGVSVRAFYFEGKETLSVDFLVRGEFDVILQKGWIEHQVED